MRSERAAGRDGFVHLLIRSTSRSSGAHSLDNLPLAFGSPPPRRRVRERSCAARIAWRTDAPKYAGFRSTDLILHELEICVRMNSSSMNKIGKKPNTR
jgi:hypothetical protein